MPTTATTFYLWRHPKPLNAAGLCLGQTDLAVDKRKLRRLANHIHAFSRRHRLAKVVWVSPLQRSLGVGQLLAKRGFRCEVCASLAELDFGAWDGRPWQQIAKAEIDAWCADFARYAPGGGESVQQLCARVARWLNRQQASQPALSPRQAENADQTAVLVVGHAGWITAATCLLAGCGVPEQVSDWPAPPAYCQLSVLSGSTLGGPVLSRHLK